MKKFTSPSQKIGVLGEVFILKVLTDLGYTIIEQNFTRKIGEIDIIAKRQKTLHFIEVKTISRRSISLGITGEDQLTASKLIKIKRTVLLYILEKSVSQETPLQIDLYTVFYNETDHTFSYQTYHNIS